MPGHHVPPHSNAQKLSNCLRYITGDGSFCMFGQFFSVLLDDLPHLDQVVIQTVSHVLEEGQLRPLLDKVAGHRLMKGRSDMQGVVPSYGFHPDNRQDEGVSATSNIIPVCRSDVF